VTLSDLVHPARTHRALPFEFGGHRHAVAVADVPHQYSHYRRVFRGIAVVCPAEVLRAASTARWVRRHGLTVEAYSSPQLALAVSAGIEPKRIVMHGDGPSWGPIRCAFNAQVRQFVVDAEAQVPVLEHYGRRRQQVILDVDTDHFDDAVVAICESDRLELVGLYSSVDEGSAVAPHRYAAAVDGMVGQMAGIRDRGIMTCSISLAGLVGDSPRSVATVIDAAMEAACRRLHFPRPRVTFTPAVS
jgi:diaminopimelate decarboxylase